MSQMSAKYDHIGTGYDNTRKSDARIIQALIEYLSLPPAASVLDIGCGTGNYTAALAHRGFKMTGVDPSEEMLGHARRKSDNIRWVMSDSENIPFPAREFSGAIATLTIHHWPNRAKSFAEVHRVLKVGSPFVLFAATGERTKCYWLANYFPCAVATAAAREPTTDEIRHALRVAGFTEPRVIPWWVPEDIMDQFWYAGKDRPHLYFDPAFRDGISSFREHCPRDELESGLQKLRLDLDTGDWKKLRDAAETPLGDYCFIVAGAV